ncbi:MFS general substrate transporter [Cucurbitaria berberidis CBS 394.84]|uniref:MFS general substrate transporter n=1 Tax=Cucurbitaria berberidis CBS 394.84 TaxID=1168544 RepID=A0A9P4GTX1_9PLEO|nr:MFS general substrate transporter [Cucurbitaria berberidis CBS 394.84]KAF1851290.1 MFS general substrate transporter [Cucurbitaria berberidis CBS 394.84]
MARPSWLSSLTQHGSDPPYMLQLRSSDGFIIGTVALAVFTDMFLYGVIVPVIPFAIQTRCHVEHDRVQYWVSVLVAIYGASLLAFSPICGWLADRGSSRRSPLLLGLLALLGSTVLLNIGNSTGILIVGRILQGASAAVVWVVGLALLADTVPQERLATATGWLSLGMSLGILISPLLGGVVYDHAGYDAVFGMAYALIGLDIVLRLLLVEKKVAARWDPTVTGRGPVTAGAEMSEVGTTCSQPSDLEREVRAASGQPQPNSVEAGLPGSLSPPRQRRRDRLPPVLSLLYSRRLLAALFCSMIQAAMMTSFDSVLAIHAANIFDWSSTGAALLFLPIVIPSFLAPFFGWISDKYGGRYMVALGFLGACPPYISLRFVNENTIKDKVLVCALLAVTGLFLALTFPPIMAEISGVVEAKEKSLLASGRPGFGPGGAYAQAYALFNVAFAAGTTLGPLAAGFIVQDEGWATMAWVMGMLSAITSVPAVLWMGGWLFRKK